MHPVSRLLRLRTINDQALTRPKVHKKRRPLVGTSAQRYYRWGGVYTIASAPYSVKRSMNEMRGHDLIW